MTASDSGAGGSGWLIGGRYRVLDRLGAGGMAEVFRAHDDVLDRDVAIKVFRRVSPTPDTAAGAARQRTELQTLARLAHPNLITLYDGSLGSESSGEPSYLVMELIDGSTLADAIERDAVSVGDVRLIAAQMGSALAYIHAANLVHRDVKPANILLGTDATTGTPTMRARLSDFGIVRLIGDAAGGQTGTQFTLGTASYLAPEQARGSAVGPPADVYALGLVLLEALTRTRAFDGPPLEAAMARLQRDPHIPPNLPAPWPQTLAAMTRRDPAERMTAQQVVDVFGQGDAGITAATTAFAPPVMPPPAAPTAATTAIPPGPMPGPVRRAPVSETRALPPVVPPVVPPPVSRGAAGPPPRRPIPTIVWLALAAVGVLLIGLLIVLLATNGSDGGSPSPTPSVSPTPSTSRSSAPSSTSTSRSSSAHRHRSSSHTTKPSSTAPSTPPSSSTSSKPAPPGPPTPSGPTGPTKMPTKPGGPAPAVKKAPGTHPTPGPRSAQSVGPGAGARFADHFSSMRP